MSRRKLIVFAVVTVSGVLLLTTGVLLALDLYAHSRVQRSVGVNRHGYRGDVVAPKPPQARRAVMLGGSTVFGWDVAVDDTVPAILERLVREREPAASVVNLGFIGEGAHAFLPTLQDYAYLDYDLVVLYEGYNDLAGDARPNIDLFRHGSAVFRSTGYFPILPLFLREKAYALRTAASVRPTTPRARGRRKRCSGPGWRTARRLRRSPRRRRWPSRSATSSIGYRRQVALCLRTRQGHARHRGAAIARRCPGSSTSRSPIGRRCW